MQRAHLGGEQAEQAVAAEAGHADVGGQGPAQEAQHQHQRVLLDPRAAVKLLSAAQEA